MSILQAIILGIVQGLTEFMPISSSAHLIIVPHLLGWEEHSLTFDVALHLGTLFAVVIYFHADLRHLLLDWLSSIRDRSLKSPYARLAWLIILGTIPAGIAGLLFEDVIATTLRDVRVAGVTLILLGILLYIAERVGARKKALADLTWQDSLWIGIGQALALIPGVSRSGSTLTAGLFRGIRRDDAARYSFLLGTPIIAAAGLQQTVKVARAGLPPDERLTFIAGMISAAIVGFLTIAFLLRYLRRHSTLPFIAYRISLGIVLLLFFAGT